MNTIQKKLNLLGLAQRARLLVSGDELVEKAVKNGQIYLVVCGNDASESTIERYKGLCERNNIPLDLTFTKADISQAIGKSRTICAFADRGMTKKFLSYITGSEGTYDK